jgi:hypothetical protein
MTGDRETDNTLWYDEIINQLEDDESSKLAAPFQEGAEAETETASTPTSKGTTEPI